MSRRNGGLREKTFKKLRLIAYRDFRDREIHRLRLKKLVKGRPEGNKKARAGNNMGQILGAFKAEWAFAKIRTGVGKPNPSAPGISQRSHNKTAKKRRLTSLKSLKGVYNGKESNLKIKVFRSPSASPFVKKLGEGGGMNQLLKN